jgi:hypothetical protein
MARNLDSIINSIGKKEAKQIEKIQMEKNKIKNEEEESDTDSEAEEATGMKSRKKRQHFTNDELLYDPDMVVIFSYIIILLFIVFISMELIQKYCYILRF